ncbi:uncharacterized protein nms isoform X1 [Thunnus albacares]|uniref:uncharacterized protein nms isoform X1 n=1 Tax=Thunnus albacares TaxID=8236 RepID=UPI001CF69F65|nr:uncharacterized protein nms isoform X1 [Thunnus albacares]
MTLPTVRQLLLFCLFWCLGCWSMTDASLLDQWEEGIALRKIRDIQNDDLSDVLLRDENENQVQNVFKRFLFHYSKALNSVGAVQHQVPAQEPYSSSFFQFVMSGNIILQSYCFHLTSLIPNTSFCLTFCHLNGNRGGKLSETVNILNQEISDQD